MLFFLKVSGTFLIACGFSAPMDENGSVRSGLKIDSIIFSAVLFAAS